MHGLAAISGFKNRLELDRFETISEGTDFWAGFEKLTKSPTKTVFLNKKVVYIEGVIYNLSFEEVVSYLSCIIDEKDKFRRTHLVRNFQDKADGEFVILVLPDNNSVGFLFLDKYSRLPLYYTTHGGSCMIARSLNEFVRQLGLPKLNIQAVNEFFVFEFFLGNKTFFENIFRLEPLEMLEIDISTKQDVLKLLKIDTLNYDAVNHWSYREFLQEYYRRFKKAVNDRVSYFLKEGQKISCSLSGGNDSRAIFGQLNRENVSVTYYTYEYVQDESLVAQALIDKLGKKCIYRKLSFPNSFSFQNGKETMFSCQGLSTLLTGQVCLKDNSLVAQEISGNNLWGGFGGEFIRHPYKIKYKNFFSSVETGLLTFDIFEFGNHFKDFSAESFRLNLQKYFYGYVENTEDGKLKHFYNEYYIHRVGNGEDLWGRKFFWTTHPMMAKPLVDLYCEMPLNYASYYTFRNVLKMIDADLLTIPIFKESFDLSSHFYFLKDFFIWVKKSFFKVIQCNLPFIWKLARLVFARCTEKKEAQISNRDMKLFFFLLFHDFKRQPLNTFFKLVLGHWKPKVKKTFSAENIPFLPEICASKIVKTYFNIAPLVSRMNSQTDIGSDRVYSFLLYLLEVERIAEGAKNG